MSTIKYLDKVKVTVQGDKEIFLDGRPLKIGNSNILYDILLWCENLSVLLILFECVCTVIVKYRGSFKLSKCHFLSNRVEYVGHDIL